MDITHLGSYTNSGRYIMRDYSMSGIKRGSILYTNQGDIIMESYVLEGDGL